MDTDRQNGCANDFAQVSATTDPMLTFDGDFDGHGNGNIKCKQTFRLHHVS